MSKQVSRGMSCYIIESNGENEGSRRYTYLQRRLGFSAAAGGAKDEGASVIGDGGLSQTSPPPYDVTMEGWGAALAKVARVLAPLAVLTDEIILILDARCVSFEFDSPPGRCEMEGGKTLAVVSTTLSVSSLKPPCSPVKFWNTISLDWSGRGCAEGG